MRKKYLIVMACILLVATASVITVEVIAFEDSPGCVLCEDDQTILVRSISVECWYKGSSQSPWRKCINKSYHKCDEGPGSCGGVTTPICKEVPNHCDPRPPY